MLKMNSWHIQLSTWSTRKWWDICTISNGSTRFFVDFKIINITIWSNLTFEQTKKLFINLWNTKEMPTYATKKTNLPSVSPNDVTNMKALSSTTMGSKTKNNHLVANNHWHRVYTITCIPTQQIYVGQTVNPTWRFLQHRANLPFQMWTNATCFQPFKNYFKFNIVFGTFHKYLVDRKHKYIRILQTTRLTK